MNKAVSHPKKLFKTWSDNILFFWWVQVYTITINFPEKKQVTFHNKNLGNNSEAANVIFL